MMTDSNFKYGINLYLSRFTIGLVYEGVKEILYNGQHLKLYPGTLFCIGPANHKVYDNPDTHDKYREEVIEFSYDEIEEIKSEMLATPSNKQTGKIPVSRLSLIGSVQADSLISKIFDDMRNDEFYDFFSDTKRIAILSQLLAADESGVILRTLLHNLDERLLLVERAINEEWRSNLSTEQLAECIGLSPRSLNKLCMLKFGEVPHTLILNNQLNKAQLALQLSNKPIADIAKDCGFPDASYFTKVFKRNYNCTPRQFREKMRRDKA